MPQPTPTLDQFPRKTYEKLRYADTDRQGHVNNAVFASMLETGRVEFLYDPAAPLFVDGCAFVIASLHLDFLGEIRWPGCVDVGTRVAKIGNSSFTLDQALFQDGQCVATAQTIIVQMHEITRRSYPLGEKARQVLQGLLCA